MMIRPISTILATSITLFLSTHAIAQSSEFELEDSGNWEQTQAPEPGSDAAIMADATRYLAEGRAEKAQSIIAKWLEENKRTRNDYIPQAYYLHGLARFDRGNEYKSLFDFETIIRDYPSSPFFLKAVEKEYEIGYAYLHGLKRKFLWFRTEGARSSGEELLIRTQERVPGSQLAEEAAMELAAHYYRRRELKLAAEMYSIFRQNFPKSPRVREAMLREIESNIARFKGPRYDGSGLVDAKLLIEQYQAKFPGESIRSGITDGLDAWIDESAAQQVLDTARWYLKVNDETSAKFVLVRLIRRHPATDAADEAIGMMIERDWLILEDEESEPDTPTTESDQSDTQEDSES
ncbi:MAG: outer membrane protein assembly factor BamD [Phycisphaerales bacterium]|nr:outer membrane protein assembly factor BamD [Phycisphaerales bacterium]